MVRTDRHNHRPPVTATGGRSRCWPEPISAGRPEADRPTCCCIRSARALEASHLWPASESRRASRPRRWVQTSAGQSRLRCAGVPAAASRKGVARSARVAVPTAEPLCHRQVSQELRRDVAHHPGVGHQTRRAQPATSATNASPTPSTSGHSPRSPLTRRPQLLRHPPCRRRHPPPSPPRPRQPPRRNPPRLPRPPRRLRRNHRLGPPPREQPHPSSLTTYDRGLSSCP